MKKVVECNYFSSSRFEHTNRLLDMIDDGVISAENVLQDLLQYLPADTVEDFAKDYVALDAEFEEE